MEDLDNNVEDWGMVAFNNQPDAINIWIGNEKSITSLHHDNYENLYCVVKGKKIFTLLPPTDLPFLYKSPYHSGKYNHKDNEWKIEMDDPPNTIDWIPVDPDNIDEEKYPKSVHCSPLHVEVFPGEILYIPSLVYHKVRQEGGDKDGTTIAINYWFDMDFDLKFCYFNLLEKLSKMDV